ncbi:MAG: ABC transporter ATP-binding protein [Bacteriovoracaceae bacterium]
MGLVAKDVNKVIGDPPTQILKEITLEIKDKEFVALTGKSGSGKSTLLYLLSTLDSVSSGEIEISGKQVQMMEEKELYRFRNETMGFVFQFHFLISELTALENVLLPARKMKREKELEDFAKKLLVEVGLDQKFDRLPRHLSGGEQQRVAIARALVMEPKILFADEPTGSLDSASADLVMDILHRANREFGTTVVLVTHDPDFAKQTQRQIHLVDGKITS